MLKTFMAIIEFVILATFAVSQTSQAADSLWPIKADRLMASFSMDDLVRGKFRVTPKIELGTKDVATWWDVTREMSDHRHVTVRIYNRPGPYYRFAIVGEGVDEGFIWPKSAIKIERKLKTRYVILGSIRFTKSRWQSLP